MNENFNYKIYNIITDLGINKHDLEFILKNSNPKSETSSMSLGPPWYPGSRYGTISIKEFKFFI